MSEVEYNLYEDGSILPDAINESEFNRLFCEYKKGNLIRGNEIVEHNLKLVIYIVNNSFSYWFNENIVDKEDLVSNGVIGLIKAVKTFEIKKNNKFSSYASMCIFNEIRCFLRKFKHSKDTLSLQQTVKNRFEDDKENTLMDIIEDERNYYDDVLNKNESEIINKVIAELPKKNKEIIEMYFGFGIERMSQYEIANKLSVTQSYVSRLIRFALKKVRIELTKYGIVDNSKILHKKNK